MYRHNRTFTMVNNLYFSLWAKGDSKKALVDQHKKTKEEGSMCGLLFQFFTVTSVFYVFFVLSLFSLIFFSFFVSLFFFVFITVFTVSFFLFSSMFFVFFISAVFNDLLQFSSSLFLFTTFLWFLLFFLSFYFFLYGFIDFSSVLEPFWLPFFTCCLYRFTLLSMYIFHVHVKHYFWYI